MYSQTAVFFFFITECLEHKIQGIFSVIKCRNILPILENKLTVCPIGLGITDDSKKIKRFGIIMVDLLKKFLLLQHLLSHLISKLNRSSCKMDLNKLICHILGLTCCYNQNKCDSICLVIGFLDSLQKIRISFMLLHFWMFFY